MTAVFGRARGKASPGAKKEEPPAGVRERCLAFLEAHPLLSALLFLASPLLILGGVILAALAAALLVTLALGPL